jgi:hypothetical protein
VPLHRPRPTQPEGLFPWGAAKAVASPSELVQRLLWWTAWDLAECSERADLVQCMPTYGKRQGFGI